MNANLQPTKADSETSVTATPISLGTQKVRFATAMTGGVSLAIWMGGVARELNLLEQASCERKSLAAAPLPAIDDGNPSDPADAAAARSSRALYLRLLDLVDATAHVDILSGTSAGGINAALLGFTRSRGLDLGPLRDVWLKTGSLDLLLRDPEEKSPPSLLQGDAVLLDGLRTGIDLLISNGRISGPAKAPDHAPKTNVFITTTLLSGETSRFTDAFGTLVQDVDHRGVFKFDEGQLATCGTEHAVALASRCSASFPAAFEPAYVPCGEETPPRFPIDTHPDMAPYANTTRPHFVADGGVMMNRPIKPLVDAVFDREADRQVRRLLLYVVPSPGDAPDPTIAPAREPDNTFAGPLLKDLGAALSQSISAELQAINDHNDSVDAMADTRLRVAEIGTPLGLALLQASALADYNERQAGALAASTVTAVMRAVTTMSSGQMPQTWKDALKPGSSVEADCRTAAENAVAAGWPTQVPAPGDTSEVVKFGRAPYDGAKATALAMLRAGWTIAIDIEDRKALATATNAVHKSLGAQTRPSLASVVADHIEKIGPNPPKLADFAAAIAASVAGVKANLVPVLEDGWNKLAAALLNDAAPVLTKMASAGVNPASPYGKERAAAQSDLLTYLAYLGHPPVPAVDAADNDELIKTTISRLFQLHVVVRSMLPVDAHVEQRVDLVQISADTRNSIAPCHSTAKDKLTGMQLHHFGAFYKSSWRANDWMWGRLDGAGWLVHLLLDPRRILILSEASGIARGQRVKWFLDRVAARIPGVDTAAPKILSEIRSELAYLDDNTLPLPRSLPNTSMCVAVAWQERIAVQELPVIAREIVVNPSLRSNQWASDVLRLTNTPASIIATVQAATAAVASGDWRALDRAKAAATAKPPPDLSGPAKDDLVKQLAKCPVPKEKLGDEVGEPLFTRTVTKAAAVASAATAETPQIPAVLRPVLATIRSTTLLAYRLAAFTRGRKRAVAAVGLGALAIGALLAATSHSLFGLAGGVLIAVGVYLLLLVSWRSFKTIGDKLAYFVVGLVIALAAVLAIPSVRSRLFGDGKTHQGWVDNTVIPWFRDSAWHAPLVFVVVTGVVVGCGYLLFKHFDD